MLSELEAIIKGLSSLRYVQIELEAARDPALLRMFHIIADLEQQFELISSGVTSGSDFQFSLHLTKLLATATLATMNDLKVLDILCSV